jgi:hypothetical protein
MVELANRKTFRDHLRVHLKRETSKPIAVVTNSSTAKRADSRVFLLRGNEVASHELFKQITLKATEGNWAFGKHSPMQCRVFRHDTWEVVHVLNVSPFAVQLARTPQELHNRVVCG